MTEPVFLYQCKNCPTAIYEGDKHAFTPAGEAFCLPCWRARKEFVASVRTEIARNLRRIRERDSKQKKGGK